MVCWLVYGVQLNLLTQYFSFIVSVSFLMIKYYSESWLWEVTKMIKHLKSAKDLTFKEDFNLLDDWQKYTENILINLVLVKEFSFLEK
jgi:hypothetical protein